jgi:hypothetical protein
MPVLTNPRYERVAQGRFQGMTVGDAYAAAGFRGSRSNACKLLRRPEVAARIAELGQTSAEALVYDRAYVVRKLVAIIEAPPMEAKEEHPLCEKRLVAGKPEYLFPPKLEAIETLCRMMGWGHSGKAGAAPAPAPAPAPVDKYEGLLEFVRRRG